IVPVIFEIEKFRAAGKTPREILEQIKVRIANKTAAHFSQPGVAYMLAGDIVEYDTTTGKIVARAFPPHIMNYATGSDKDVSYQSATGYRYIVVRAPVN
ncbi:MAG TPA: hypothetical protein VM100_03185, partial [Longimicrobiales bacterium]|nr:hypothetical protein [Longimicrobiales bacterium]